MKLKTIKLLNQYISFSQNNKPSYGCRCYIKVARVVAVKYEAEADTEAEAA